ncbi:hypothetical protein [Mycolicibacterium fortuitum]
MFDEYYRRTWGDTDGDISPEQTDLATSLRIPILTTEHPRWNYITGIVVRNDRYFEVGVMPTEDEVRVLAAHLETYCEYYRQSFRDAMRHFAPFDIDGGANLGYYMKRPDGGWCYTKRTWRSGPSWWPSPWFHRLDEDREGPPLPLSHVISRNFNGWPGRKRHVVEASR